jgi:uncharacterized integral membrane protein
MIRKAVATIILLPLAVIIVLIAVANRRETMISLDPFAPDTPALALPPLPLFLIILTALIAGVFVGGVAVWMRQAKWRRATRALERDLRRLKLETDQLRQRVAYGERMLPGQPSRPALYRHPGAA